MEGEEQTPAAVIVAESPAATEALAAVAETAIAETAERTEALVEAVVAIRTTEEQITELRAQLFDANFRLTEMGERVTALETSLAEAEREMAEETVVVETESASVEKALEQETPPEEHRESEHERVTEKPGHKRHFVKV